MLEFDVNQSPPTADWSIHPHAGTATISLSVFVELDPEDDVHTSEAFEDWIRRTVVQPLSDACGGEVVLEEYELE